MKKCVLSAAVLGLLVPAVYAMDGAAEPAAEIEVPVVEVTHEVQVEVDHAPMHDPEVAVDPVPTETDKGDVAVDGTVTDVAVTDNVDSVHPDGIFHVMHFGVLNGDGTDIAVDGNADTTSTDHVEKGTDNAGEPVHPIFYSFGAPQPVEGGVFDPHAVDLAAQSGTTADASGGAGDTQPNYRALDAGGETPHIMYFSAGGLTSGAADNTASGTNLAEPQLLNDEQRGAVRGLRTEEESAKPRSGLGKFMAKFKKPKSQVTQASATVSVKADKTLTGKLAEIDRMRDTALRTGDRQALAKADKLEKELRAKTGQATRIPTRTK